MMELENEESIAKYCLTKVTSYQDYLSKRAIVFDSTQDKKGLMHRGYGFPAIDREEYMTETEKHQIHEIHNPDPRGGIAESPQLTSDLFARELGYQACLAITEGLLRLGLMTNGEVHKANELLLKKYRPPIGSLLAEAG
jgi:hypothetical protein